MAGLHFRASDVHVAFRVHAIRQPSLYQDVTGHSRPFRPDTATLSAVLRACRAVSLDAAREPEWYHDEYSIDADPEREPELPFHSGWTQELGNHRALLDCFFAHIQPERSLCFFYAKQVPFVEDSGSVIVGVGRGLPSSTGGTGASDI